MFKCKVCSEEYETEFSKKACERVKPREFAYARGEDVTASSWSLKPTMEGWHAARVLSAYNEKVTHIPMYLIQFRTKNNKEDWKARLTCDRLRPLRAH